MEHVPLKKEKIGVLVCYILSLVPLFPPDSTASPGQHVLCAQPGQAPKAAHLPLLKVDVICLPLV